MVLEGMLTRLDILQVTTVVHFFHFSDQLEINSLNCFDKASSLVGAGDVRPGVGRHPGRDHVTQTPSMFVLLASV